MHTPQYVLLIQIDGRQSICLANLSDMSRKFSISSRDFSFDEELFRLQNFARVFVELAESLLEKIVNEGSNDPSSLGSIYTLELLLLLAGHHDYSVRSVTVQML